MAIKKYQWWLLAGLLAAAVIVFYRWSPKAETCWFADQTYNYEVLRTLGEGPYGGSEVGEVLAAIKGVGEGDDEAWFIGWESMARRVEEAAGRLKDPVGRGRALLRASNYYRTAEFFLAPEDSRRLATFHRSVAAFERGLRYLGVEHYVLQAPYENTFLTAIYYPGGKGATDKPLILAHGGFDSTQEEMYFFVAAAALERGYNCLTFAGPGQGDALRDHGLRFTPEWEKPTGAVLDYFIDHYGRPKKIVLVGVSLGGYLAPRAAAFDKRIDGVAAHNVCFDFQEAALRQMPGIVKTMYDWGWNGLVDSLVNFKSKFDPGLRWGIGNARLTLGAENPTDVLKIFAQYNLEDESSKITGDVLITAGEKDHFFPVEQVEEFKAALTNAHSITTHIFREENGGHEHCQQGALSMFHGILFDWVEEKF